MDKLESLKARPTMSEGEALKELGLLYNHAEDDSRQFTRWQMAVAIQHGHRLGQQPDLHRQLEEAAAEVSRLRAMPEPNLHILLGFEAGEREAGNWMERALAAEQKLAKAVEALEGIRDGAHPDRPETYARATLNELKG